MNVKKNRMAFVLWMTGLPCSGKTTLAKKLSDKVNNLAILDGDDLREWLSPKDFSRKGINEHNRKVANLAKLLVNHNVPVLVSLVSPFNENREDAHKIIGDNMFIETYIKCSLSICEERDVKGMYKKARQNQIKDFVGVNTDYEIPDKPDLILDTEKLSIEESVNKLLLYLKNKNLIGN